MNRYATLLLAALLLSPLSAAAQRNKKKKAAPKKEEVVEEDPRIAQMLASTQQIMFVDSFVVDGDNFMSYIPLSPECGTLTQADGLGGYTNELGDRQLRAYKEEGDTVCHIFSSNLIDTEWTVPTPLNGIDAVGTNFPYLMPDGTTLYFAQGGEKALGGYDIFVTRYDAARNMFLRPENLGMPFASAANDYLYVIDETYQLGYFVTDRRQPKGKVCVYVFLPPTTRRIYQSEAYSEQQLQSLAGIGSIADTWSDNALRSAALARFSEARAACQAKPSGQHPKHRASHSTELDELHRQLLALESSLQQSRITYAHATPAERAAMRNDILNTEARLEALQLSIKQKTKELHNKQHQ